MKQTLNERLEFLEESKQSHFNMVERISGQAVPIRVYTFMVLKRSLSLIFGFTNMIRNKNFPCAAPLIRLQIDNLLRFRAAFLVDNQSQFVVDVIQGKEIGKLKDRFGEYMTDRNLQSKLSNEYPWLKSVYRKASGYIHLSEEHFFNALQAKENNQEAVLKVYIGPDDKFVSNDVYQEALEDMILVTHSLLSFLENWASEKNVDS